MEFNQPITNQITRFIKREIGNLLEDWRDGGYEPSEFQKLARHFSNVENVKSWVYKQMLNSDEYNYHAIAKSALKLAFDTCVDWQQIYAMTRVYERICQMTANLLEEYITQYDDTWSGMPWNEMKDDPNYLAFEESFQSRWRASKRSILSTTLVSA